MANQIMLSLLQPAKAYRYGIDAFLLARFAKFHSTDLVCDLGAGVGILGFLALTRGKAKQVTAVEVQQESAALILKNAQLLRIEGRVEVLHSNWKNVSKLLKPRNFHVVISNPPYRKPNSGKISPDRSKAIAKHEIEGSMSDLIAAAIYLIKPSGRFYLMYPPLRLEELISELAKAKFKIQRMACVHPYFDYPATLIMVEAVRSPVRELVLEAPVIVYRDPDHYTPEIEAWVGKKKRV